MIPWVVGVLTFMALEAVCMVYSNVLRDHVNKVRKSLLNSFILSPAVKAENVIN